MHPYRPQLVAPPTGARAWFLMSSACVVPAALSVLEAYMQAELHHRPVRWQDLLFWGSDWILLGMFIPGIYYLGKRFPLSRGPLKSVMIHVAGSLGLCIGWASLGILIARLLNTYPAEGPLKPAFFNWLLISLPFSVSIYFAVLGCVYAFSYFIQARREEAHAARLAAQLAEARLGALRMQLNPHFLFNSLNALSVLVREGSTSAASRMLEQIAEVLRQVLRSDQPQEIPLSEEITFLEQYLSIEQVRFSDRLHVLWSVEANARAGLVPSFVTQPLVENAIKHGVLKRADSGTIEIVARVVGQHLEIKVRDDGAGIKSAPRVEGVGLSNTRERLRTLYKEQAELRLASPASGGTEATLRIPYREVSK